MENSNRETYFDFLRGIAILMVIGIHTYTVRPFEGATNTIQIVARETINFAVPLFLAISGYFIGKKKIENSTDYTYFLKRQLRRVYVPAVLWSLPMAILCVIHGQGVITSIGKSFLCMTFGPYYFIVLIIQFYLLHPVVKKLSNSLMGGALLLLINTLSLFIYNYVVNTEQQAAVLSVGPFVYWMVFYFTGVYLSERERNYSLCWPLFLLMFGMIAQIFETKCLMSCGRIGIGIKISSWIYSEGVVLLLFSKKIEEVVNSQNIEYNLLAYLGKISFGVYLIHVYFLMVKGTFIPTSNWIISFVFVAIATSLFVVVIKKILPTRLWRLLGLQ